MPENQDPAQHLLSPYRVLDLTDQRGLLCGKILADLGADVIQVEPPGGSTARKLGPFYHGETDPEKSLYWWSYAANKKGVTLNLESERGRELLLRMAEQAHFLIESASLGYMDELGLGYDALSKVNSALVMVSITPFGQDGPYANFKAPDIVGTALGGFMWLTGDADRPPVRVSSPHFYLHGSAAGAAGAMLAHTHRALTGQGQRVDVSCQQAVARTLAHAPQQMGREPSAAEAHGCVPPDLGRQCGAHLLALQGRLYQLFGRRWWWRVGGQHQGAAPVDGDEEGYGDEYLNSVNWEELGYGEMRAELMVRVIDPLMRFFSHLTRAELVEGSVERRILMFPVSTPQGHTGPSPLGGPGLFQGTPS